MDRPTRSKRESLSRKKDRTAFTSVRAEVVDILASAVFALLLRGEAPAPRPPEAERQRECS